MQRSVVTHSRHISEEVTHSEDQSYNDYSYIVHTCLRKTMDISNEESSIGILQDFLLLQGKGADMWLLFVTPYRMHTDQHSHSYCWVSWACIIRFIGNSWGPCIRAQQKYEHKQLLSYLTYARQISWRWFEFAHRRTSRTPLRSCLLIRRATLQELVETLVFHLCLFLVQHRKSTGKRALTWRCTSMKPEKQLQKRFEFATADVFSLDIMLTWGTVTAAFSDKGDWSTTTTMTKTIQTLRCHYN